MVTANRARELLASHGVVQSQLKTDWAGTFALRTYVEDFYRDVGPADVTIESYGNPFFLPRLAGLWQFQAGYRWNGLSQAPIEDWNDDWLVVADEGGDPFILSRGSGKVLHDTHGKGVWDPWDMFPDITTMAACLAMLGKIVASAGDTFTDEDCCISPEHRERARVSFWQLLGSESDVDFILKRLDWG